VKAPDGDTTYFAELTPEGTFQVTLPPDTYDLNLSVEAPAGPTVRNIPVARGVLVHEDERAILNLP
jgi:hypothetical protein